MMPMMWMLMAQTIMSAITTACFSLPSWRRITGSLKTRRDRGATARGTRGHRQRQVHLATPSPWGRCCPGPVSVQLSLCVGFCENCCCCRRFRCLVAFVWVPRKNQLFRVTERAVDVSVSVRWDLEVRHSVKNVTV